MLQGTLMQNAVDGIATFSGLFAEQAGQLTFDVTSGTLDPITGTVLTVDPAAAVDAGFLDALAAPTDVVTAALTEAAALATLDVAAYRGSISRFRTPVLELMAEQIAADRASLG